MIKIFYAFACFVLFSFIHIQNAQATCPVNPQGAQVTGNECLAINEEAFCGCLNKYGAGLIDTIKIDRIISCNNCSFAIPSSSTPLKIYGTSNVTTGIVRNSGFETNLFEIIGLSQGVEFQKIKIAEKANIQMDDPGEGNPICTTECNGSLLKIKSSLNVKIIDSRLEEAKRFGVKIEGSNKILLRGNYFSNSWIHAVWISKTSLSSEVKIENNTFYRSRSNAILFSSSGSYTNVISGNTFSSNHFTAAYFSESSCGGWCPGGQVLIGENSNNLLVENNIINESIMTLSDVGPQGIEVHKSNVQNVSINNNFITKNFKAIRFHSSTTNSSLSASGNTVIGNRSAQPIDDPSFVQFSGNCIGQMTTDCPTYHRPSGNIAATECIIPPGSNKCTTTLSFSGSYSPVALKVYLDSGTLVSAGSKTSGSITVNWITRKPVRFNLYSGNTFLKSVEVAGVD